MYHKVSKDNKYLRAAMYNIYDKECCYCKEKISPKNMQVDHILAKAAKKSNDVEFNEYLDELSKDNFELNSIENYFITCPYCNSKKSNNNFTALNFRYFHEVARKNANKIFEKMEEMKSKNSDFPNYSPNFDDWDKIDFTNQHKNISHAIMGYRLTYNDVEACPRLPQVEEIKHRIQIVDYFFVKGEAGSGKSISIYQAAYDLFCEGWSVYKFRNQEKNRFSLPKFSEEKVLLIIDDSQSINKANVEELFVQANSNVKMIFGCTTENSNYNAESVLISNAESIKVLENFYIQHEKEITNIVKEIDDYIGNDPHTIPLSNRISLASEEKTPWAFNYVIRGGWNSIKNSYEELSKHNDCGTLAAIIAFMQIVFLDRSLRLDEIENFMTLYNSEISWSNDDLDYLINNRIIMSMDDIRIVHLESAKNIFTLFISDKTMDEYLHFQKFIEEIYCSYNISYLGWIWIESAIFGTGYTIKNIFSKKFVDKLFNLEEISLDAKEKGYALYLMERLFYANYYTIKSYYARKNKDVIMEWLSNVDDDNVYSYSCFINGLINVDKDFFNQLTNEIDFSKIPLNAKSNNLESAYSWGCFLNRLFMHKNEKFTLDFFEIIKLLTVSFVSKTTSKNICHLLYYLSNIYYNYPVYILNTMLSLSDILKEYYNNNIIFYISMFTTSDLSCLLGIHFFQDYKPNNLEKKVAKMILNFRNEEKLISFINNSSPRYWHPISDFFYILGYYDKKHMIELASKIELKDNPYFDEYVVKTNGDFHYIYSIAIYGDLKKNKDLLLSNSSKIKELFLPIVNLVPDIAIEFFKKGKKIIIFSYCWYSASLNAIKRLDEIDKQTTLEILQDNSLEFIKMIEELDVLSFDSDEESNLLDILNFLNENYESYYRDSVNSINNDQLSRYIDSMIKDSRWNNRIKRYSLLVLQQYLEKSLNKAEVNTCIEKVKKAKVKRRQVLNED